MPELEDIEAQRELLRVYRRNLALYLQQQAEQGGSAYVTPAVANGILDARDQIAQIKAVLRGWGQVVDDHPNDMSDGKAPAVRTSKRSRARATPKRMPLLPPSGIESQGATPDTDGLETYFTDMEYLRGAFRELVSATILPKRLLVIHGIGGSGKSSLLRMFRIQARRASVPIALVSGDEVKSSVDLLAGWSDDLQAAGVPLPITAKILLHYRNIQAKAEHHAQQASALIGALKTNASESTGAFPLIGAVTDVVRGAGDHALIDWLGTFLRRADITLLLDPTRHLTNAFLADVNAITPQQRIVLLLDTYEQVSTLEEWMCEVARQLSQQVLLVIAGRAMPRWNQTWPSWMAQARVEELKPMSPEVMRQLISRYYATMHGGTPDPAQVEAIISFARGLPVVVTSAVQLWVAYGVEDFQLVKSQVVADLVDRLLDGVSREFVPILEAAAALRWFNKDLLRAVTQENDVHVMYDELRRFPFIRPRAEGLALHDAIREIIDENVRMSAPEWHQTLHRRAIAYLQTQLSRVTGQSAERLWLEKLYHEVRVDEGQGIRLFQEQVEGMVRFQLVRQPQIVVSDVLTYPLFLENSRLWREYYRARLAYLEARYTQLEKIYQEIGESELAEPRLRAYALCDWAALLTETDHLGQPDVAEKALRILDRSQQLLPNDDSKLLSVSLHRRSIFIFRGELQKAVGLLQQDYRVYEQKHDIYGMIYTAGLLQDTFGIMGSWKEAASYLQLGSELLNGNPVVPFLRVRLVAFGPWYLVFSGQYAKIKQALQDAVEVCRASGNIDSLPGLHRMIGLVAGLQGDYQTASDNFAETERIFKDTKQDWIGAKAAGFLGAVQTKRGELKQAEYYLTRSLSSKQQSRDSSGIPEVLIWLGVLYCTPANTTEAPDWSVNLEIAEQYYRDCLKLRWTGRRYFECAALTGLVRIKHTQGDYDSIPALLTEAEALAQQCEYNDHLASLRLSQAQLAWDGALPALGRGFDAALAYFKQALIYALRYNRFLLDEVLWGGGVGTPLKPIIPHCLERTFEGQRMLTALRDWWQTGANDIGVARPDTISPIPEGIGLLEAERIAREREPGDGTPQRRLVDAIDEMLG